MLASVVVVELVLAAVELAVVAAMVVVTASSGFQSLVGNGHVFAANLGFVQALLGVGNKSPLAI